MAEFLSFLFGRADAASASVRSGSRPVDAEVADVLAVAMSRAEALKHILAGLPDAKMVQAAHKEVDAAVSVLKKRLGVRGTQCSKHSNMQCLQCTQHVYRMHMKTMLLQEAAANICMVVGMGLKFNILHCTTNVTVMHC